MITPQRALIVIDVQNEYFSGPLQIQYPPRDLALANVCRAMDAAREAGLPILVVRHLYPSGSPLFADGSEGARLHPEIERRAVGDVTQATKSIANVFALESVTDWIRGRGIDTATLVGFMANNCVLGSAAGTEPLGISAEVLSDATGSIHLVNNAGRMPAEQVHGTLLALLNSKWAAVASTESWLAAVSQGSKLERSSLAASAQGGWEAYSRV